MTRLGTALSLLSISNSLQLLEYCRNGSARIRTQSAGEIGEIRLHLRYQYPDRDCMIYRDSEVRLSKYYCIF